MHAREILKDGDAAWCVLHGFDPDELGPSWNQKNL
jgi:hypothetical protein